MYSLKAGKMVSPASFFILNIALATYPDFDWETNIINIKIQKWVWDRLSPSTFPMWGERVADKWIGDELEKNRMEKEYVPSLHCQISVQNISELESGRRKQSFYD